MYSYESIKQRILDNIKLNLDKREGSFLNDVVSPISMELAKSYIQLEDILSLGFIEDTFDEYLDMRVGEFGVYRKEGTKATGSVIVEGSDGATIINGSKIKSGDLYYVALNDVELPGENILYVEALDVGYKYNLLADTEFELVEKDSSITRLYNTEDFVNGVDIETDLELRERFLKVVRNPSTSGNKYHYEEWALETPGVGRAIVYPLWNGNGTVKVMLIGNDNKPVSEDVLSNVKLHIEENMPIGCQLTVSTPTILNISIRASIELDEGYTVDDIKEEFELRLGEYIKGVTSELVYSKVYGILSGIVGVNDISSLTLNEGNSNISIADDKLVSLSDIILSEVE